jgi:DNA-binding cell septation regulator SpoVG
MTYKKYKLASKPQLEHFKDNMHHINPLARAHSTNLVLTHYKEPEQAFLLSDTARKFAC